MGNFNLKNPDKRVIEKKIRRSRLKFRIVKITVLTIILSISIFMLYLYMKVFILAEISGITILIDKIIN